MSEKRSPPELPRGRSLDEVLAPVSPFALLRHRMRRLRSRLLGPPPILPIEQFAPPEQRCTGVIFGSLTLLTGSIWAKISWGVWWAWSDDQLVLFLVLFLFYCAYFMLRFSVDAGPARANMCAVYALFGVVLIPISFLAIRLSHSFIHPVVFTSHGPQMTGAQFFTFCIGWLAMLFLLATLYQLELAGKRLDARLRELRELLAT